MRKKFKQQAMRGICHMLCDTPQHVPCWHRPCDAPYFSFAIGPAAALTFCSGVAGSHALIMGTCSMAPAMAMPGWQLC